MNFTQFEKQAALFPDKTAVWSASSSLTYDKLNKKANRLAYCLNGINSINDSNRTEPHRAAVLLFGYEESMITGLVGAIKSGITCAALDASTPAERVLYILKDSGSTAIVTNNNNLALAEQVQSKMETDLEIINLDLLKDDAGSENPAPGSGRSETGSLLLYTTGSTGTPKGVRCSYRGLLDFFEVRPGITGSYPDDKETFFSSYSHSFSLMAIFSALVCGTTLCLYDIKKNGLAGIAGWIKAEGITVMSFVPTIFRSLMNNLPGKEELESVRCIIMGGEAATQNDVRLYKDNFSDKCTFLYCLGSTETNMTLANMIQKDTVIKEKNLSPGSPIDGVQVYILDEEGKRAAEGEAGELYLKSRYLFTEYLNKPGLTGEVLVPDPVTREGLVFRSGDLGRLLPNGRIEFLGRRDSQVKIRGFRVNPQEIEAVLSEYPSIKAAAVKIKTDGDGQMFLCAYYESDMTIDTFKIRSYLSGIVPDYMVPLYYVGLTKFPQTPTGKIDRMALPEPPARPALSSQYAGPDNTIEEELVRIWQDVLDIEGIGVLDNFFELGGTSITALHMSGRFKGGLITPDSLVRYPTIRELQNYITMEKEIDYDFPLPMQENLQLEYHFQENGELHPIVDLLDCRARICYYAFIKNNKSYKNIHQFFMDDITLSVGLNKSDRIEQIEYLSYPLNFQIFEDEQALEAPVLEKQEGPVSTAYLPFKDLFTIKQYAVNESNAIEQIESLLNRGEIIALKTYMERVPFSNLFISFDYPFNNLPFGHSFAIVAYDKDHFYYVESPPLMRQENCIPFKGNKAVNLIKKEELLPAMNAGVDIATITFSNMEKLDDFSKIALFKEYTIAGYSLPRVSSDRLEVHFGKNALDQLIRLAGKEVLLLDEQVENTTNTLASLLLWKSWAGGKRRKLMANAFREYPGGEAGTAIGDILDTLSEKWLFFNETISLRDREKETLFGKKLQGQLVDIAGLEGRLIEKMKRL